MCRRVSCPKCGRPTFAGCGAHVEQVLAGVPVDQRCQCAQTAAASPAATDEQKSWLKRLWSS